MGNLPVTCNFDKDADTSSQVVRSAHPALSATNVWQSLGSLWFVASRMFSRTTPRSWTPESRHENSLFRPVERSPVA